MRFTYLKNPENKEIESKCHHKNLCQILIDLKIPDINTQNLYITAKLTSEAENKGDILPDEPDSWFAKKKKSFEKANRRTRRHCRKAVKSQGMFWLIIILVFLNTCVLATEHYRQPAWLDYFQEYVNLFFVVLFTFEMVLKMYSLGFQVSHIYFCLS